MDTKRAFALLLAALSLVLIYVLALFSTHSHELRTSLRDQENRSNIELIQVIFRHGARAPNTFYPTDPYGPQTFHPVAVGDLTNKGKIEMFIFGTELRKKYSSFLGKTFLPDSLVALSTYSPRAKKSLQLTLAGMYPPYNHQIWKQNLLWEPMDTYYTTMNKDVIFFGSFCPKASELQKAYAETKEFRETFDKFADILRYVANSTGLPPITDYRSVLVIYNNLIAEKYFGLVLPKWTESVLHNGLQEVIINYYRTITATEEMKKFASGYLLKNIVKAMVGKANGTLPKSRKVYLYSGHDYNVVYALIVLGIFDEQPINFTSNITFELHNIHGVRYVKIIYQNYDGLGSRVLQLPNCSEMCPLITFVDIVGKYFPADEMECGGDIPSLKL